jgi:hypothetical protein
MRPAPREKPPQISPIFISDKVTLHVSREKDGKWRLFMPGGDDTKVVQPDGCGQARRGWRPPVGQGLVPNLAHPGGNITGFTSFEFSIGTKWLEVLKQTAPRVTRIALLFNPESAPLRMS